MVTFCIYPKTRQVPGDVILAICICDFFMIVSYFITAFYVALDSWNPSNGFCDIISLMSITSNAGDFIYNCAFCLYLYLMLTNLLKLRKKIKLIIQMGSLILSILIPLFLYLGGALALGEEGMSLILEGAFGYYIITTNIIQISIEVATLQFIKRHVPEQQQFLIIREDFCQYYVKYITITCIILFFRLVCVILLRVNEIIAQNELAFNILVTIFSILNISEPFVLSVVRLSDPLIRLKVTRIYKSLTRQHIGPSYCQSIDENWLTQLASNLKVNYIVSILQGIRQSTGFNSDQTSDAHINDLTEIKEFKLKKSEQLLDLKVISYAPRFFERLQKRDRVMIDIITSLDPELNKQQIQSFQGPDGGKSGQFFFFSSDHKLVIKAITEHELQIFLERLSSYADHIQEKTMISLIYGLYTFENDYQQHIILQRNIAQCPQKYILNTYDLKGSEYDREVIVPQGADLSKITLKDINFHQLEEKIKIAEKEEIRNILLRDVEFLRSQSLLDYSLLVIKIDWESYTLDNSSEIEHIRKQFSNPYQMIASEKETRVYYHMAIIDYLQEWNTIKQVEEASKKMLHGNIQTSATHPNAYASRFVDKLLNKILI